MADISKEIQDLKTAVYGKEVRGSMISLAEKVNADGEAALSDVAAQIVIINAAVKTASNAAAEAGEAVERANDTIDIADQTLVDATTQATFAADSAILSESWAVGGTGAREGEDKNSSRYFAERSQEEADRAEEEADRASQYANIVAPGFYVDLATMALYMKAGVGVDFKIFNDNILYWKIA